MLELGDFRQDLLNQTVTRASVDGVFKHDAFAAEAADLLIGADEVDSVDLLSFTGNGRRNQKMAVSGFFWDETDRSISLIVVNYEGGVDAATMTYSAAESHLKALENYLREALSGEFVNGREPSTLEYQLAETLQQLARNEGTNAVSRFRLYLVTDAQLSSRARTIEPSAIDGTPIEFHIWDIQRLFQLHISNRAREPLELDLSAMGCPVPALRVADGAVDVVTYLAAIPGSLLSDLYRDHGSRLIEGNIRSFLTIKGKINRGIRETILKEPGHFLAYNNGISATASAVVFKEGSITGITDLQIVNGGQTTASLFYAVKASRDVSLADVFVQMKLVVVTAEDAREMAPLISRYANSQNAVREDDFFSNSPFHIKMEEFSRRILAPAQAGVSFQTKWYYERTRGQYLTEKNKLATAGQRKFEAEFPRIQVIGKIDAARYVVSWEREPHMVSAGAQKNFKTFAKLVATDFDKNPAKFNENYFKRVVAMAILFESVRSAISKADWYEPGYLANLTTYSVAKLSLAISKEPRAASFDLLRIWETQAVGQATLADAVDIGRLALQVLTDSKRPVVNVTEWAKREGAWKQLADMPFRLSESLIGEYLPVQRTSTGRIAITVGQRFPTSSSERDHLKSVPSQDWPSIRRFMSTQGLLTGPERRLLTTVTSGSSRMIDLEDVRGLLWLYVKALNAGWVEE